MQVPRLDLLETTLLLGMAGIDVGRLLCLDGPPPVPELLSPATAAAAAAGAGAGAGEGGTPPELRVTLLDHNRIRPPLAHLSGSVVEILDHHEDEGDHPHVEGEARQVWLLAWSSSWVPRAPLICRMPGYTPHSPLDRLAARPALDDRLSSIDRKQ